MSISLRAMRYYCAALRHGSLAAAASALNVAPSAVASAIDQIEDAFGLVLTIRQRARGLEATADGQLIAQRFQALLDEYEAVMRDGTARQQSLSGDLRIGYYAPIAPAFLPSVLSGLLAPNHDLTLHLEECDNGAAQAGLRRGDYDLILYVPDAPAPWMWSAPLIDAPPYCLVAAGHRLAEKASIPIAELAEERLVSLNRPMARDYYRALFEAGPSPQVIAQCSSTEMVRSLVGAKGAVAILNMVPFSDTSYAGDRLVAVPLSDPLPPLTLSVGTRSGTQRRAVSEIVERLTAYFAAPLPLVVLP